MADGGGGTDLDIRFQPGRATARDLVDAWPGHPGDRLVVDGTAMAENTPLEATGLADGAMVHVGRTPPPADGELHVVAGPLPPISVPLTGTLLIGRGAACDLRLDHLSVAPAHALVEPVPGGWSVCGLDEDGDGAVSGEPLADPVPLAPGAMLSVGAVDLQLIVPTRPPRVAPPATPVHRAVVPLEPSITVPPPPPDPPLTTPAPSLPGALTLALPVLVGVVLAVTVHPTAGLFTAATPLLAVGAHLDARRRHHRDRRKGEVEHAAALDEHRHRLTAYETEAANRERRRFPSPIDALGQARSGVGLWPVRDGDPNAARLAVGRAVDPVGGPVTVDLAEAVRLGVAGPPPWVDAVARALVMQATARAGPRSWRLWVPATSGWVFARWLPHRHGDGTVLHVEAGADDAGLGLELAARREQLTDRCGAVLEWAPGGAELWDGRHHRTVRPFVASVAAAEAYGRASARWTDPGPAVASLPDHVGLSSLLAETGPVDRGGRRQLRAPLGIGPDGPFVVDLVADGPHALVAGTTGAGKSELLRTWVTALADRHPPTAVAFVLVDYKGGSAFDACARLPHVTGVVTDLDAGLAERLLVGLRAEVHEREVELRRAAVGDLRDLTDGPPRLVVVVDEFATLAAELPDFLGALVDVARRGRSLGVHLVLATQRPAGAVNDDIRANTSLRVCLRTLDIADSQDVLGGPEAGGLPADRPGRAWVRSAEEPRLIQVATTAGAAPTTLGPAVIVRRTDRPWPKQAEGPSELETLVDAAVAEWGDRPRPSPVWLPPLPERLVLPPSPGCPTVAIGRADRPADRAQPMLTWSPESGHLVVLGGRGTGRTTTLRTAVLGLARSRPADTVHLHVIARPGELDDLADLPHVSAVLAAHDRASVRRLLGRVGVGGGPSTVVVIDGYESLVPSLDDFDGARLLDDLDRLARDGPRRGVVLAVTATRPSVLPSSVLASPGLLLALRLDDPADYGLLGLRPPRRDDQPGRGWSGAGEEIQVGLVDTTAEAVAAAHGPLPPGTGPRSVGPLPNRVRVRDLAVDGPGIRFGRRDRDLATAHVVLPAGLPFVVSGPPRSGRSTALARLVAETDRPTTTYRAGDDPDAFRAEVRAWLDQPEPRAFAVDDAEALTDDADLLRSLVTRRHPDAIVLVSVRADAWRSAYGTWLSALRPAAHGLALSPDPGQDAESWSVPLPALGPGLPPGRGVLVTPAGGDVIQVAVADD